MKNRIVLFAYSLIGHDCLKFLIDRGYQVVAVVTHLDNPNEYQWFPSVTDLARQHQIPVYVDSPAELLEPLKTLAPDLILSAYYRQMIGQEILDIPPKGAYNIHGSFLPHYRGRCPANWVLVNGETHSGATLHKMVKAADAGEIVSQKAFLITLTDNAMDVTLKIRDAALEILASSLDDLLAGTAQLRPQDLNKGSYYGGRSKKDATIDWRKNATEIYNLVRSQLPYPHFPGGMTYYLTSEVKVLGALPPTTEKISSDILPGTILSVAPLKVACGEKDLIEITNYSCEIELKVWGKLEPSAS